MPNCSENRVTEPTTERKVTKASDLNIGQLVFAKDHLKGSFDPTYTFDHRVAAIMNKSTVVLTTPDRKEKRHNIHHIKPMSAAESTAGAFQWFEIASRKIQATYSKITSIICMQETTSCSNAPNAKVGNFNNYTVISILTYCRTGAEYLVQMAIPIPCINYY